MGNYITEVEANLVNGLLRGTISFRPGLNILSGENGTLKTKLLQHIKATPNAVKASGASGVPLKICAISPKRNAERRKFEQIIQSFRQKNRTFKNVMNDWANAKINDQTFENYPALGDLYYVVYTDLCKDGGDQCKKMDQVTREFNAVIKRTFEDYDLSSEWNASTGAPDLKLTKKKRNVVPLDGLSLGEQEILSLILNLYTSRDSYDVYLIDEPEIHLNWHLEEKLFAYMDSFCSEYEKQIIVATHSRALFKPDLLKKTQFLYWNEEGRIAWGTELADEQRRRIAGEAIDIIKLGDFPHTTFFVEDSSHTQVIETLAAALKAQVNVTECGNSANVKSLFRLSKSEGGWQNSFFLVDGDNEGNPFPGEDRFLHLDAYCIENYLLAFDIAAEVVGTSETEIRQRILDAIKDNRERVFKKSTFFEFLVDSLTVSHIEPSRLNKLDASEIMDSYLKSLELSSSQYVNKYVGVCANTGKLKAVFPERLICIIEDFGKPVAGESAGSDLDS